MSFEFPPYANTPTGFTTCEPLISVQQLKENYLFGIDLSDRQGNPIPDSVFQHQITASVNYLEHKLDIVILKREFVERYDYRSVDYVEFNFLQLKKRPVNEFTLLRAMFPNGKELINYPKEWYVVENESAQLQLSPVEGTFSGLVVSSGGAYLPLIYGTRQSWPHLFEATYTAGFDSDKIPAIINEIIGMRAAIRIFDIMGDILFGPLASESVNMDGASVSKSNAIAPGIPAFAGRIKSYREDLKDYMKTIKQYYNGIPFTVS